MHSILNSWAFIMHAAVDVLLAGMALGSFALAYESRRRQMHAAGYVLLGIALATLTMLR